MSMTIFDQVKPQPKTLASSIEHGEDAGADKIERSEASEAKSSTTVDPKTSSSEEIAPADKPHLEVKARREENGTLNIKVGNFPFSKCALNFGHLGFGFSYPSPPTRIHTR